MVVPSSECDILTQYKKNDVDSLLQSTQDNTVAYISDTLLLYNK